jgi:hypothetical protein
MVMNDREVKISSWISKIYPDFKFQKWSSEKVIIEENMIDYSFFKDTGNVYLAKINPKDIVGIRRIGYIYGDQTSWLNLFYSLKRLKEVFEKNKCLEDLIQHINNPEIGKKTVVKYNGCYFIGLGLHRLCLSKILELKEVEVEVNECFFDQAKFDFFQTIRKFEKYFPTIQFPTVQYGSAFDNLVCVINQKSYLINNSLLEKLFQYLSRQHPSLAERIFVRFGIKWLLFRSQKSYPIKIESVNDFIKIEL